MLKPTDKEKLWSLIEEYREANAEFVYVLTLEPYVDTTHLEKAVVESRDNLKEFIETLSK
jgi:hypothetical protein